MRHRLAKREPFEFHSEDTLAPDSDDSFNLNGDVIRQRAEADRRPGVSAIVTEDFDQQIGTSVDDLRMLGEIGNCIHHAQQLDDPLDTTEISQRRLYNGQKIEPGETRIIIGLFDRDIIADLAGAKRTIRLAWPLP